jgi:lipid A 3-O-deacylase
LTWDWEPSWALAPGLLSPYLEASISDWRYERRDGRGTAHLMQLALTPVLRWRFDGGASPWFAEAGVGLSVTSSLYETAGKRFSTRFNFGNHLGAGRNFGARREHEVVLRVEHFSNAGIKHPNPGENFFQVRYAYRFR